MLSGEASEFLDRAVMRLPLKDELHVDIAGEAITMDERSDYAAFGSKSHGLNKIRQKTAVSVLGSDGFVIYSWLNCDGSTISSLLNRE